MSLNSTIITGTVNIGGEVATKKGFGNVGILGATAAVATAMGATRALFYESAADMLADTATNGILITHTEYIDAVALEAQGIQKFALLSVKSGDADWSEAVSACIAETDDWYGLVLSTRDESEIDSAAPTAIAAGKLVFAQTADADVITSAVDDIASELQDESSECVLCYHSVSATPLAAAACGAFLRADPDVTSTHLAHKTLVGIAKDDLSSTARTYALAKNVLIYEDFKGLGATYEGKATGGKFVDQILARDWYGARADEDVAELLVDLSNRDKKVPFNAKGYALVENVFRARHEAGVGAGHFDAVDADGEPVFRFVAPAAGSDKATRKLVVTAYEVLSGAVGTLTYTTTLATE